MNDTIITALIMALASVVCQLLINKDNRKKREIEDAVKDAQLQAKLKEIDRKLDEHNGYASRFGAIEEVLNAIKLDIALIKNNLDHLKEEKHEANQ